MNSPIKDRYASALKELSLLGGQIAYHFPDYQAILGNVQPRGTRALFRQQTRLMAVVEGVAIIKIGSSTIKELASTHRHSNALTEAFKSNSIAMSRCNIVHNQPIKGARKCNPYN